MGGGKNITYEIFGVPFKSTKGKGVISGEFSVYRLEKMAG